MASQLIMVGERVGYFSGSVNIGYVETAQGAVLIDSGLDRQAAKKIQRGLAERGQSLKAIVQTHAHADHFGGNAFLLEMFPDALVFAPAVEEAVLRYPQLEPYYLNMGALPPGELQNKFLQAAPSRVDQVLPDAGSFELAGTRFTILPLPGHSWNQIGLVVDDICFAADSYYGREILEKHKLPFLVDVQAALDSIELLRATNFSGYLPGHGPYETQPEETLRCNLDYHLRICERLEALLVDAMSIEELLERVCGELAIEISNLTSFVLYRTALLGYLAGLLRQERVSYQLSANRLLWQRTGGV